MIMFMNLIIELFPFDVEVFSKFKLKIFVKFFVYL